MLAPACLRGQRQGRDEDVLFLQVSLNLKMFAKYVIGLTRLWVLVKRVSRA